MNKTTYKNALGSTNASVILFYKLAELEKKGKRNSKEFKDIFLLLNRMVSIERKIYNETFATPDGKDLYLQMNSKQRTDYYFLEPSIDNITNIRFLNYIADGNSYTLDGIILDNRVKHVQSNQDISFFNTLNSYLQYGNINSKQKNTIIDFKYALIATSNILEKSFLSGELLLPVTNLHMTEEDLAVSRIYLFQKVSELLDYLFSINDSEITEQTLPMILYIESCLCMLDPILVGSLLVEVNNSINLNRLYGAVLQESRDKISNMLNDVLYTNDFKVKKWN